MAATPDILPPDTAPAPMSAALPEPATAPVPRHVAIIMDGNGRWAAARGLPRWAGHHAGIASVRRTVEEARKAGVRYLTLYAFSTENWKRPSVEISALWELLCRFLVCERAELKAKGIRLVGIGRRDRLPLGPRTALELTERLTAGGQDMLLRLAIDYGSQWAIAAAAQTLARQALAGKIAVEDITEAALARQLQPAPAGFGPHPPASAGAANGSRANEAVGGEASYAAAGDAAANDANVVPMRSAAGQSNGGAAAAGEENGDAELAAAGAAAGPETSAEDATTVPPPDLLIRTGGEVRLSNFLLWECAYTELWFTRELWPEFERESFATALAEFARRQRRFGAAEEAPDRRAEG